MCPEKKAKREKPSKVKAKAWLKSHGHKAQDVDDAIDGAENTVESGLLALHKVTPEQLRAAM